ncbi:unnamed protein product [Lupinus luteus]|uniref:Uncharacterized protein n=1 Tax=Lupinus luteus TaxID=3873 RepID=A0AAV1X4F2_LUPLU
MGNCTSRVVGCLVPFNGKGGADLEFLEPLDEGLGHSFCYVRPSIFESPAITPSNSERYTLDSSTLDSETMSGSFRHDSMEDSSGIHKPGNNCPETTFKTISGASVSANVSTARTGNQSALFANDALEPATSFEGAALFAAIPLQPVPRGSGPLNGFMSGPLEPGFASGPLDKGGGFMSGPIEKGVMSDKELEGLLWDYEDNPVDPYPCEPEVPKTVKPMSTPVSNREELSDTHTNSNQGILESSSGSVMIKDQSSNSEIVEENAENRLPNCGSSSISGTVPTFLPPLGQLPSKGIKSVSLYELLQMESCDEQGLLLVSEQGKDTSVPMESTIEGNMRPNSSNLNKESSRDQDEDPTTSGKNGGIRFGSSNQEPVGAFSVSGQRQNSRKSFIGSKIRKMYRKPNALCKKLFPWSYDWDRDETFVDEKLVEASGPIRKCKSGVDHNAVLRAKERALERT